MVSVALKISNEFKIGIDKLPWVNWSEVGREEALKRAEMQEKLEWLHKKLQSKEEQDLIKWSVDLGRKAKKGRFKKLLAGLSPREREELLE